MTNRRHFLTAVGASLLGISGCRYVSSVPSEWENVGKRTKVLVTFPGIYSFVAAVGGSDCLVKSLTTSRGVHFHGDLTEREIMLAKGADVFFINGLGLDDYIVKKLEKPAANPNWNVVDLGKGINEDWLHEGECHHDHHAGEAHDHGHDPHVWLGIKQAKVMVDGVRTALKKLAPQHAANFDSRADAYLKKLDELAKYGQSLFATKADKKIITFHDSLQYFAESYGITISGVIETKEGVEPTPDDIDRVVKLCQKKSIRVIVVEPQFPRTTSARIIRDTLKNDRTNPINAEFASVDPLETADEIELNEDLYEKRMRQNLDLLASALS